MNPLRGRWENFWSSEQTSVVRLVEAADVLDKMVYALTNPVKDNLVAKVVDWPGVNAFESIISGGSITAVRPDFFFREDGSMPATVTLTFARPPEVADMTDDEFADMLRARVQAVEADAEAKRSATGGQVLRRQGVLDQDWRGSPSSPAPHRELSPRVATKNKWSRIEALQRNGAFVTFYRTAFEAFRKGVRAVLFPAGTFWLRPFAGATCEPWPAVAGAAPA